MFLQRNTFQLVVASTESSSYAILLYPRTGLQFASTSIGGGSKPLEASFNEGTIPGLFWGKKQGTHFLITKNEEASIRNLTEYEPNLNQT